MINANQIAILVIAHFPGGIMIDLMILRQYDGLGKVYKPNTRLLVIMHEQQRTANIFVTVNSEHSRVACIARKRWI